MKKRMPLEERKQEIMEETMKVAAEVGLDALTAKHVAARIGISEALIFKYFLTKEGLLTACYTRVCQMFIDYVGQIDPPEETPTQQKAYEFIYFMWERFFRYLIEMGYRTTFFIRFRESRYFTPFREQSNAMFNEGFAKYIDFFQSTDDNFGVLRHSSKRVNGLFGLGVTNMFAKWIIQGGLEYSDQIVNEIWQLLWNGVRG